MVVSQPFCVDQLHFLSSSLGFAASSALLCALRMDCMLGMQPVADFNRIFVEDLVEKMQL